MTQPTQWTLEDLRELTEEAKANFRRERTDEPLEQYTLFFDMFSKVFSDLVDKLGTFNSGDNPEQLVEMMSNSNSHTALRYITAPPISDDDLKVLADSRLSAKALRSDPEGAKRVRDILFHVLDQHRFPWIKENREPSKTERQIAIISSAALVAARKVETDRRSSATKVQEEAVKKLLKDIGFEEEKRREIKFLDDAPMPGHYCGESLLGGTRADIVIRLYDRRVLALECKASNSEVNSFKRVNHEAAGKAAKWFHKFGHQQIIPGAVLSGVFNPSNLETAQLAGLNLFWSHRLSYLTEFIKASKSE